MMINWMRSIRLDLFILGFAALVNALWLFYIDEGKYNFHGLFQPDYLFFLLAYILVFYGFQLALRKLLQAFVFRDKYPKALATAVALVSLPTALVIFLWIVKPS